MREALLKLVRMAIRDGYLSDDLLKLLETTEDTMKKYRPHKTRDSGKGTGDKKGGGTSRLYPQSGNKPAGPNDPL